MREVLIAAAHCADRLQESCRTTTNMSHFGKINRCRMVLMGVRYKTRTGLGPGLGLVIKRRPGLIIQQTSFELSSWKGLGQKRRTSGVESFKA